MVGECNNLYYAVKVDNDSLPAVGEVVTGEDIGEDIEEDLDIGEDIGENIGEDIGEDLDIG